MKWIHGLAVVLSVVICGDVNGQIISPYQVRVVFACGGLEGDG